MKFLGALAFIGIAGLLAATPAAASTVSIDFTGLALSDGDSVSAIDTAEVHVDFETRSGFGKMVSTTAPNVLFRSTADYSGDQALYAANDGDVFQFVLQTKPGFAISNITFDLGSQPNQTHETEYRAWAPDFSTFLNSDPTFSVDGTSGGLVSFFAFGNVTGFIFQFGTSQNVGLRAISFDTVAVAATPIPGALLLFATGLGGLGMIARRRRAAA